MSQRIVFLTRPYPRYSGDPYGAEVLYLAEAMAKQGEEVAIITTTNSPVRSEIVKVHVFPLPRIKVISFVLSFFWAFFLTLEYAWFGRMNVLNVQWAYPLGPIGAVVKKLSSVTLITTARGSDLSIYGRHPRWKRVISWVLQSSAGVITVGSGLREIALSLGVAPENCQVIPSVGVDQKTFREAKEKEMPGKGAKLLYVGGLVPVKGLDILIEACSRLQAKGVEFHLSLVGKGLEEGNLKKQVQSLQLGESVSFLGEVPHPEIPSYFKGADLFILPSRQEGLGIVLIEALAAGTAVVATRTGGIPDIISNEQNGLLVAPESSEQLAEALERLINDSDLRERLVEQGFKTIKRYTYEEASRETREFLREKKE